MAYSGPRENVEPNFNAQGFMIPEFFNPADFLLDIISIDHRPDFEKATRDRVAGIVAYWAEQEKKVLSEKGAPPETIETNQSVHKDSRLTPMWIALPTILERSFRNM